MKLSTLTGMVLSIAAASGCENGPIRAAMACEDAADAFAATSERCGDDYDLARDDFIDDVAFGSCSNIIRLRNHDLLYDECFPWFDNVTCSSFNSGYLHPACRNQLLFRN